MPELHWYCRSNLERLLRLCGIGLSENWKSSWCCSIVAQDYVKSFWRSNNFCFIWLNRSKSDFIKANESVLSIRVWQLLIHTFWLWPFIHCDDGLSHILIMTLRRIVRGSSSDEPRPDSLSDFSLEYHCQTGSKNCDGSCDARPENWVIKDDHLKVMSIVSWWAMSIVSSSPEVCRRRQPRDREWHVPGRICTQLKSGWTSLQ